MERQGGRGVLAEGYPKSSFWATDSGGLDQVGCVYTAQGFEFDYVGVVFGRDLVYRGNKAGSVSQSSHTTPRSRVPQRTHCRGSPTW